MAIWRKLIRAQQPLRGFAAGRFPVIIERSAAISATADITTSGVATTPTDFPLTSILDDFNRANDSDINGSASWTGQIFTGDGALQIVSNQVSGTGSASGNNHGWNVSYGPDCEVYIEIVNIDGEDSVQIFSRLTSIGGTFDGYSVRARGGATNNLLVIRWDDGVATIIATLPQIVAVGDWFGFRITGDLIEVCYKDISLADEWFLLGDVTDATYSAAGFPGLYVFSDVNIVDNFGGGTFGVTVVERSVAIDATADIATAAVSFSVFERGVAVDATASISTAGQRDLQRAVAITATADISSAGHAIVERTASLSVAGTVTVAGERVVERAADIAVSADVSVSGVGFTVFESSAAISASAAIETSGLAFSVLERSAALSATAEIATTGTRIVDRAVSVTATAGLEASGLSFSVVEAAVSISGVVSVEVAGQFFSILERQVVLDTTATITISGQTEQQRQVAINATASIDVSGVVVPPGITEHERSASLDATVAIETSAAFFSVVSGAVSVEATATVAVSYQRELQRAVSTSATASVSVSGVIGGVVIEFERAVAITATAVISVNSTFQHPTPSRRTFVVESPDRIFTVAPKNREYLVTEADRVEEA